LTGKEHKADTVERPDNLQTISFYGKHSVVTKNTYDGDGEPEMLALLVHGVGVTGDRGPFCPQSIVRLPACEGDDGETEDDVEEVLRSAAAGETEGDFEPVDEGTEEDLDEVENKESQTTFL
jgi:hypothetical protein